MDQYKRLIKVIGEDNLTKLMKARVLLVGIGGVGGSSLEMLARSGILNITVIDYDKFEITNLNRQILSLYENIGENKVDVARKRVLSINNKCNIKTYNFLVDESFLDNLEADFDYIIDACDDMNAKVLLVKYAIKNNIKIISSCGTGNKINPEALSITNIWKTYNDPLAKKLRYLLRKEGISYKLPVVSSSEVPILKTKDIIGSVSIVPNTAGIFLASYVINDILKEK